jgi:hypothetical protein
MVRLTRIAVAALYAIGAVNASVVWFSHDVYHLIAAVAPEPTYMERDSAVHNDAPAHARDHLHDHSQSDDHSHDSSGVHSHRHAGDTVDHSHATVVDLLLAAEENHNSADKERETVLSLSGLDLHLAWVVQSGTTLLLAALGQKTSAEQIADQPICPDTPPPMV